VFKPVEEEQHLGKTKIKYLITNFIEKKDNFVLWQLNCSSRQVFVPNK